MKVIHTEIPDVLLIEPKVYGDERGFFYESFNDKVWREATGQEAQFVQDNHSRSAKGVLRGLHYQRPPSAQAKLVRCVIGEIFDVAVDIRKSSATFGKWVGHVLSAENKRQMWIPEGFAHGFCTLTDVAEVLYKTTNYYDTSCEVAIAWDDPRIGVQWPIADSPSLSKKDADAPIMDDISDLFFK